ncbi:protein asteroid homolog 1 isoform X2 [Xenopus laevis]|nr:protein asteroid homolog 1 isoform X2 [Xenopus laevis]
MGIHGLMGYVGSKKYCFYDLQLRNTKIIIDGNNLYHRLYFELGLDLICGGDYHLFTDIVHKFFESLSVCEIQAYVVFDGGCDISDKKLETLKQRAKEKITMAHSLSKGEGGSVLPLLVREVFIQVLEKMEVPFVQCFAEADRELVVLANLWNCPVLTFDSDFCIFDLKAGFCPLNSFQWKNIVTTKVENECFIPAKCYSVQQFCKHFNNMNMSLLPLFAVLVGNDYINLPALERFFSKVHLPIGNSCHSGRKHVRIHGLLHWLSAFVDAEEAMDNVLSYLKAQDRDAVRQLLCSAMEEYSLSDTVNLVQFFQKGIYNSPTAVMLRLPDWVQRSLARGQISPLLRDALVMRRLFLHSQVEDMKKPSAHLITQPVRRVIYGLLVTPTNNLEESNRRNEHPVKTLIVEFDRLEKNLRKSTLEADTHWNLAENISLSSLPEASTEIRLKLLLDTLEVKTTVLASVPLAHRLSVAVTCYWVRYADPKVKLHHLKALLMGSVCGELYDMFPTAEGNSEDFLYVHEQLQKIIQGNPRQKVPNKEDLHIFCQWQCCLQVGLHLNQLLCTPLLHPNIKRLYSGTLVHLLCQKLKSSSLVEDLFNPCPPLKTLYQQMMEAVLLAVPEDCFKSRTLPSAHKSKMGKKKNRNVKSKEEAPALENQPMYEVTNRYLGLMLDE